MLAVYIPVIVLSSGLFQQMVVDNAGLLLHGQNKVFSFSFSTLIFFFLSFSIVMPSLVKGEEITWANLCAYCLPVSNKHNNMY